MKMDDVKPIYGGKREDFNWIGFGSGKGTNNEKCAEIISPALILSDKPRAEFLSLDIFKHTNKVAYNGFRFVGAKDKTLEGDYELNTERFNQWILETLRLYEKYNKKIDLIVLGGYMRLISNEFISAYRDKIINVHSADLSILNGLNQRKYIGAKAVYDVLAHDRESTKSSVIIVDEGEDHGEILTQGPPVKSVFDDYKKKMTLDEYAVDVHQKMQKEISDHPALTTALKLIANGKLGLGTRKDNYDEWRTVYQKMENEWLPLLYGGLQVEA